MVGACLYLYTCLTFNILNFFVKPAHKYPNSMLPMLPTFTLPLCYHHQLITRQTRSTTASSLPPSTAFHYSCLFTAFVFVSSYCYSFCSLYHFTYHQATPSSCSLIALWLLLSYSPAAQPLRCIPRLVQIPHHHDYDKNWNMGVSPQSSFVSHPSIFHVVLTTKI